ncbi:C-GCAxxG-C-C family protein [Geobacter grbiciae]|uniref:C-GCAxxG-C-C family protein n=1 Tax=Geobacter grbiciae TaxID=155042 RepID=UPI001C0199DD|nr:C-GCAxxG-C-C family protein [Geobacter grbiciae]MBT1074826.1 C-GCAxxG-C-C family protein [Geobacter grbiciae]
MFWQKKQVTPADESVADKVGIEAEGFYRSGKMHCAEAVLMAARNQFFPSMPEDVVGAASGFGGGSGVGCVCGAVAGGTMAFGFVLKDDKHKLKRVTKELHEWFKQEYGASCCRIATKNAKDRGGCAVLTGEVAKKMAELLAS